ncbi:MAG: MBOAT family protein [Crocinitomicaceae bacterium]|nr:MBOAT family protein [Crocinitomicaceae bacterium]
MERIYRIFSFESGVPLIFTQLDFWLFFLVVMILFSFLHKNKLVRSIFLTAISLFFYFKTSGLSVLILGFSLIFNYFIGRQIAHTKLQSWRKTTLTLGVLVNLLILIYFKYAYFFTESFNEMFQTKYEVFNMLSYWKHGFMAEGTSIVEKIIVPAGVSFFTFTSISYIVDVYRKEVQPVKSFFHYSFFVSFFPHIILGPIARAKDFIPQIDNPYELNKTDFSWAIAQIVKGLVKKLVLADYVAVHFIDKVVDSPEAYPGFVSIVAMWGYSLQIYADFSGYTDIATGLARLMGFKLMRNFNSPYKSVSVADFWRRWHISLGSWLKNYLYIPLGGNKTGGIGSYIGILVIFIFLIFITQWYELIFVYVGLMALYVIGLSIIPNFKKFVHRDLNLLITMIVGGLWHNPDQNFVIWGAMNGIALVFYKYWRKVSPYENSTTRISHFWKIFITFNFITFTRIWFRLVGDEKPLEMLNHIGTKFQFSWQAFEKMCYSFSSVLLIIVIGMVAHWLPERVKLGTTVVFAKMHVAVQAVLVALVVFLAYQLVADVSKPFVYFQF